MTSKLSWIAFVPFSIAAVAIKIIQLFFMGEDGTFYGFNNLMLSYLAIACALVVLLFAVIFCLVDRKISPVYLINKNIIAGIFGLFLAVALACDGANRAFVLFRSADIGAVEMVDIVLTILSAVVFVVLGLNHFVGNGGVRGLSVFYLIPTLFATFRLVECFLGFTTVSILITDVTKLACYIFVTLFLFNYAMIVALMKGKSPVRTAFIYGLPSVVMLLSYGVYEICSAVYLLNTSFDVFANIEAIELSLLGLYILAFVIEMSAFVKTKDEIEIITDADDEEYQEISELETQSSAFSSSQNAMDPASIDDDVFIEVAQTSLENAQRDYIRDDEVSDFIYGTMPEDDDFVMPVDSSEQENDSYLYEEQQVQTADMYITTQNNTYDKEEQIIDDISDVSMDRIDKLILEISEDEFK